MIDLKGAVVLSADDVNKLVAWFSSRGASKHGTELLDWGLLRLFLDIQKAALEDDQGSDRL